MKRKHIEHGIAVAIGLWSAPAAAADYYVDGATGSDSASGTAADPFASIQKGYDTAMPGDTIVVADGNYEEAPTTARDGTSGAPITLRAANSRKATITSAGNVVTVRHAYQVVEGLVIDGQLQSGRALRLRDASDHIVLRDLEVRNSGNNCIDIAQADDLLIEGCNIHHCLFWNGGPKDAHGITGDSVTNVTVRDCDISMFSGDAIQFSPAREFWDSVLVERTRMWIAPLAEDAGDFQKGVVYGENAFDSKTPDSGPRSRIVFRDVVAYGFEGFISNQGAFNVKENVDFTIDGATIYGSEIAFRMRGPAKAVVRNVVSYGNDSAVRYEDAIEDLTFQNVTFADPLEDGGGGTPVNMGFANALFVAGTVPTEATGDASNLAADASFFVDAMNDDYRLLPDAPAVDQGQTLAEVTTDRLGVARPVGSAYDIGAYEWTDAPPPTSGAGGAAASAGAGGASSAGAGGDTGSNGATDSPSADGSCGCRYVRSGSDGLWWLVLCGAALLRRRRQALPHR